MTRAEMLTAIFVAQRELWPHASILELHDDGGLYRTLNEDSAAGRAWLDLVEVELALREGAP